MVHQAHLLPIEELSSKQNEFVLVRVSRERGVQPGGGGHTVNPDP